MEILGILLLYVIYDLALVFVAVILAQRKGRHVGFRAIATLFLNFVPLVMLLLMPRQER